ncbi:right-handed parallel beta-helix repeat-containing protein [Arenibacter sp. S6351L]|uniref:alpha-1,3-galactosidase-related protein n=1 Tax=Arenibacter sp. S6351L TaxID=2926407 RepID=UPI001FF3F6EB|nr:right-handed parallel beta-helix repeat-containing protein [Arenibacter sp. S6351L]MCK0134907.1 right-handed parallel beta-helix repeat-containing protein [Arenibacter sp. S6351L]
MNIKSANTQLLNFMRFSFIFLMLCFTSVLSAQQIIDLKDYGVRANSFQDAVPAITRALADAAKYESAVVRFPKGRIDLWPAEAAKRELYVSNATESDSLSKVKNVGILLENMSNITLEGDETIIMSHGKMVHLANINSRNITVKNIGFDYERPSMSEFTILEVTDDFALVEVHRDSRYSVIDQKVVWYGEGWKSGKLHTIKFDPDQEAMYYFRNPAFENAVATDLGNGQIQFRGDFTNVGLAKGDVLTMRDTYRDCLGVLNHFSENLTFENIGFHYMHGLGMVSQFSKNISVNGLRAKPRSETGRIIAGFADFLHFSGCYGEISIENSLFSGSHDDPVNVHGTHLRVVGHEGDRIKVRFMHHQTWNLMAFEAGDSIGYVDNENLLVYENVVVKKVTKLSKRELELKLDRPVPKELKEKHCVENLTKTPELVVRNNRFEHTNTRGLLVTTRKKVVIEGNTFFRTGMHAILIANDCNSWYESGAVKDLTIRNNKFIECGYNSFPNTYPIAIMPETHSFVKNQYVHSNISIVDNEFTLFGPPLLFARATKNITFERNKVLKGDQDIFPISTQPMFFLEHCEDVSIRSNVMDTNGMETMIQTKGMKRSQIKYDAKNKLQLITK